MTNEQVNPNLKMRQKKNKAEMKHQVVLFVLMIFLTIIAFITVGYEEFSVTFQKPFILLLAIIQVIFQLFYFMHMKHKGHATATLFLFSGLGFGIIMAWAFLTIIWW